MDGRDVCQYGHWNRGLWGEGETPWGLICHLGRQETARTTKKKGGRKKTKNKIKEMTYPNPLFPDEGARGWSVCVCVCMRVTVKHFTHVSTPKLVSYPIYIMHSTPITAKSQNGMTKEI
jgi:hypothetical protein